MTAVNIERHSRDQLIPGLLGTKDIIFMIMACAAPMGVLAGLVPLAFAFGNGVGTPGTLLVVCAVMFLFAIGYVRMIPHVRNAGAFYAYISSSLGKQAGIAAAYIAVIAYIGAACSTLGAMAFFFSDFVLSVFGANTRWEIWAALGLAIISWLGYRKITLTARVLTVALLLEVALIVIIDVIVLFETGFSGLDFSSFSPTTILAPGLGISMIYAFNGCIGFEATAIYQEEARDRKVTIPRATYGAILIVGTFYVISSWCLVLSIGPALLRDVAAADPGRLVTGIGEKYLGLFGRDAINFLVITSLFAACLGFFNNITRYIFALARDGLIPSVLGEVHPKYGSPSNACILLTIVVAVVVGAFAAAGLDPLLSLSTSLSSMGAVGLMCLLMATSLSIPIFFAKRGERSFAKTVAPCVAGVVMGIGVYLAVTNYSALTGTDLAVVNNLPWLYLPVILIGWLHGSWLKANRPSIYRRVGSTMIEEEKHPHGATSTLGESAA